MIVNVRTGVSGGASAAMIPLAPGDSLPRWTVPTPASAQDLVHLPGVKQVREVSVAPGHSSDRYAYTKETQQRNLFRIPLR
jgi:hypothetical protein